MEGTILLNVNRHDRPEDIIPYIEKLTRPGMHVIFLLSYPLESPLAWLQSHWVTVEDRKAAISAGRKIIDKYCWETQRILAEQLLSPCRKAMRQKGVKTSVTLYTGSLRNTLKNYEANGGVYLVMKQAQKRNPIWRACEKMIPDTWLRRFSFSPPLRSQA